MFPLFPLFQPLFPVFRLFPTRGVHLAMAERRPRPEPDFLDDDEDEDEDDDEDDLEDIGAVAARLQARVAKLRAQHGIELFGSNGGDDDDNNDDDDDGAGHSDEDEDELDRRDLAELRRLAGIELPTVVTPRPVASSSSSSAAVGEAPAPSLTETEPPEVTVLAQARVALNANQTYQSALLRQLAKIDEAQRTNLALQVRWPPMRRLVVHTLSHAHTRGWSIDGLQGQIRHILNAQQTQPRLPLSQRRAGSASYFTDKKNSQPPPNPDTLQWEASVLKRAPWTEWARVCTSHPPHTRACALPAPADMARAVGVAGVGSARERAKLAEGVKMQNQLLLVQAAHEKYGVCTCAARKPKLCAARGPHPWHDLALGRPPQASTPACCSERQHGADPRPGEKV